MESLYLSSAIGVSQHLSFEDKFEELFYLACIVLLLHAFCYILFISLNGTIENSCKEKHRKKDSTEKERDKNIEKNVFHGAMDFEKLSQDFRDLLLSGEDSDITIKVNDSEFHVHKLILSARSPVFASMFKHDMKEKNKGVVDICDSTANAFHDFLLYLYSGKLEEFSRENIFELYMAAEKYDVKQLKSACVKFMVTDLCIDTFCGVLSIALLHEESVLLETVSEFFKKNLKTIIVTVEWQTFLKENPTAANELLIKALNHVTPDSIL